MKLLTDGYMKEYAPIPMIRGFRYSGYYVPMYDMPYRSDPVTAVLADGSTVTAVYNAFSGRWLIDETNEVITQTVIHWWG